MLHNIDEYNDSVFTNNKNNLSTQMNIKDAIVKYKGN